MKKVFICSPYRGDTKNNLENAIGYCRMADIHGWLPICPHVYFTRVYPDDSWHSHYTWESWGMELMKDCSEIWIFCSELTEGMIEAIEKAKELGLTMKFYNTDREEINRANYLIHTELGPAYRRVIAESYGDRFYIEGNHPDCRSCRRCTDGKPETGRSAGAHPETGKGAECPEVKVQHKEEGSSHSGGFFRKIFRRK